MARNLPGREQGQLMLAAVRVLAHREQRPPSAPEVAVLLALPAESTAVLLRVLVELGALREIADAYEARYEIGEAARLEDLPEGGGAAMKTEIESFSARRREKEETLRKRFEGDLAAGSKQQFSKLEEELKKFRGGGGGRKTNLWGEPVEEPDDR